MTKCLICNEREAIKRNSHLIPSFLVAMVASYDHSYKRDKELMFTISPHQSKIYTGELPDTELERIFDTNKLSEERIANELSKNTAATDYIFCPTCESDLSKYLESPYSSKMQNNKRISNYIPLFFWLSVIWRMSINGSYGFKLPVEIEANLQISLKTFFQLKLKDDDLNGLVDETHFKYRIVNCKDFCKTNGGYIYAKYDGDENVLTVIIGDICVSVTFEKSNLHKDYSFFGLEKHISEANCNDGRNEEMVHPISSVDYKSSAQNFKQYCVVTLKLREFGFLDYVWKMSGRAICMPIRMKMKFMEMLYDDQIKLGERHTSERYVEIFNYLIGNVRVWY